MADGERVLPVPDQWKQCVWMQEPTYCNAYERSMREPDEFWALQAQSLNWVKRFTEIRNVSFVAASCAFISLETACSRPA